MVMEEFPGGSGVKNQFPPQGQGGGGVGVPTPVRGGELEN